MVENKGLVKVIDIETSALLEEMLDHSSFPYKLKPEAKLHVVVIRDAYTDELFVAEGNKITKEWMKESLKGCKYLVQHNGVKFDLITLKLFGVLDYSVGYLEESDTLFGEEVKIIDTLILSRLFNPDRFGGHSLSEWGQRTGCAKMDFRGELIKRGIIPKDSPKGFEFKNYTPLMTEYCILDTEVGKRTFFALMREKSEYNGWDKAIKMEHKLADLAIRRESLGFWFDNDLAIKCVEDLTQKMDELRNKVNPVLPPKPMTKTELSNFTPPNTQFLKSGKPSTHIVKFAERIGGKIVENEEEKYFIEFEGNHYELPFNLPLKTHVEADIANLDHVKMTLTDVYGWIPQEWAERDFTKDSKKQSLSYEKRVVAFERWLKETEEGKYKKLRLQIGFENFKVKSVESFKEKVLERLHEDFPVRLPTSPKVRVGVEKELCPNLVKLGEQVSFANDFALYLTYKHRKSSIAGGEIEDMDFDEDIPNSGFLSMYREEDGRVPTPAIEIGANTSRYRHIGVCNIARPTSVYGKELRSLFGCGENAVFYGFDYASIEARIMAHYVFNYTDGEELGKTFVAEKPNDLHCYSEDTEILTENGWKTFGNLTVGEKVAQVDYNYNIEYVIPKEIVWQRYTGDMVLIENKNISQFVTPNHRVLYNTIKNKKLKIKTADYFETVKGTDIRIPLSGNLLGGLDIDTDIIRLIVATQADGCLAKDCSAIQFSFTKERKIARIINILNSLGAPYSVTKHIRKGREEVTIRIKASSFSMLIRDFLTDNKSFNNNLLNLNKEGRETFIEELQYWDGTLNNGNIIFDVTDEKSVDIVQAICHLTNMKSTKTSFVRNTAWGVTTIFRCFISGNTIPHAGIYKNVKRITNYDGFVGCVAVKSGLVVVRRKGRVFLSGNTKMAEVMGVPRSEAKSINYGIIYGASWKKIQKMTGKSDEESKRIVDGFWNTAVALREFKDKALKYWESTDKKFVPAIDGRKVNVRSPHSILNALFQSAAVIYAKYIAVMLMERLEKEHNLNIDPFIAKPDVCSMIEYHDEEDLYADPKLFKFEVFETKEKAEDFVNNWQGEQLSAIGHSSKGYYICLPNVISKATTESMRLLESNLKINVPMGFEYMLGRTWYDCH